MFGRMGCVMLLIAGLCSIAPAASADEVVVTTTQDAVADDGKCSLREAVTATNGAAPLSEKKGECRLGEGDDHQITLDDKTYVLTIPEPQRDDENLSGDLDLLADVDIIGRPGTTIRQDAPDRVIDVGLDASVTLRKLTITGGEAPDGLPEATTWRPGESGGGIRSAGSLIVDRVTLVDNEAGDGAVFSDDVLGSGYGGDGGAINAEGPLEVRRSTIRDNRAGNGGAGVSGASKGGGPGEVGGLGGFGGGISAMAGAIVSDSVITGNTAGAGGRGGNAGSGISSHAGGSGGQGGGGGGFSLLGSVTFDRTTIANNAAGAGGDGGTGGNNPLATGGPGGDGGSAGSGGGAQLGFADGGFTQSTVSRNATGLPGNGGSGGGGNSQGASGTAGEGGAGAGVDVDGSLSMRNVTISGNQATGGWGGGIYNSSELTLNNVTIANNAAVHGGGLLTIDNAVVNNAILADNSASIDSPDCLGEIESNGYNIIEDQTGCTDVQPNDLAVDPKLGPLKSNGGPTQTHAIAKDSWARNHGHPDVPGSGALACEGRDQRNKVRKTCDSGAYELVRKR